MQLPLLFCGQLLTGLDVVVLDEAIIILSLQVGSISYGMAPTGAPVPVAAVPHGAASDGADFGQRPVAVAGKVLVDKLALGSQSDQDGEANRCHQESHQVWPAPSPLPSRQCSGCDRGKAHGQPVAHPVLPVLQPCAWPAVCSQHYITFIRSNTDALHQDPATKGV